MLNENDSSFRSLLAYLNEKNSEDQMKSIIYWYIITRLLYLLLSLKKAESKNIELEPKEFFLSQINGNSTKLNELFIEIKRLNIFLDNVNYQAISILLINKIQKFEIIKKKKISIAIDEAGVANQLLEKQFTSLTRKKRGLLTGIVISISLLNDYFQKLYISGTHLGIIDKDTIISSLGKESEYFIHYTNPSSCEEQLELLKYYYNTKNIEINNIKKEYLTTKKRVIANSILFINNSKKEYLTTKKRVIANSILFINNSKKENKDLTEILNNSIKKSYDLIKKHLKERLQILLNSDQKQSYKKALEELIFFSFFYRSNDFFPLSKDIDQTTDLMNLGVVSQKSDPDGTQLVEYIKDNLIIEVCKDLFNDDFNIITKKIIEHFQRSLITDSIKSKSKGDNLEVIILALFLNKEYQNKSLSELNFIKKNLSNECDVPEWLKNVKFKCDDFENQILVGKSDIEILKFYLNNKKYTILKPSNNMHPDGILIIKYNEKYYFIIVCDKMSWDKVRYK
jgi:hypothetical protein